MLKYGFLQYKLFIIELSLCLFEAHLWYHCRKSTMVLVIDKNNTSCTISQHVYLKYKEGERGRARGKEVRKGKLRTVKCLQGFIYNISFHCLSFI